MAGLLKKKSSTRPVQQPLSDDAKQELLLKDAKHMVSNQAFQMKRALDANNILEALKYASNLINELRTGQLSPKTYYALYIFTVDELHHLETFISEGAHNRPLLELYEMIQYAGNILPRLYLLVTVGSVYIKKQGPAKDLLQDLVELCRGVQHPTRGLFLRTYLSEMTKDKLPDEGSKFEGDVKDSIDFILINFTEMNKLWVRMQHGIHDLGKREQEREELNVLVGKNLSRLSQLDGLTVDLYNTNVLPRILDQIIKCKDRIAQNYLMVIIIQVFSDEYHLQTLSQLLDTLPKLEEGVKVATILNSLIVRLASYCSSSMDHLPSDIDMFELFKTRIDELAQGHKSVTLEAILEMCNSLLMFCLRCYKDKLDYIDRIYEFVFKKIEKENLSSTPEAIKQAATLLKLPLETFNDVKVILKLKNYDKILNLLSFKDQRFITLHMVDNLRKNEVVISTTEETVLFLNYLSPLSKRSDDTESFSNEEWYEDQMKVAYSLSLLRSNDIDTMFTILNKAKDYFLDESVKAGITYTLVPLVYKALHLVQIIHNNRETDSAWEKKAKLVFKYAFSLTSQIRSATSTTTTSATTMIAFHLYLQCALQSGKCNISKFPYEFITQGLTIYEEDSMAHSQYQYDAIRQLISTVHSIDCFEADQYDNLAKRLAQHSSKLSQVENQTRAMLAAAHLFTPAKTKEAKHCFACLSKATQSAQGVPEPELQATLLVEILDHFICLFSSFTIVEAKHVNSIIQIVQAHFSQNRIQSTHTIQVHFSNIREFVKRNKNWKNLIGKDQDPAELGPGIQFVTDISALSKADAKKEAEKWAPIEYTD